MVPQLILESSCEPQNAVKLLSIQCLLVYLKLMAITSLLRRSVPENIMSPGRYLFQYHACRQTRNVKLYTLHALGPTITSSARTRSSRGSFASSQAVSSSGDTSLTHLKPHMHAQIYKKSRIVHMGTHVHYMHSIVTAANSYVRTLNIHIIENPTHYRCSLDQTLHSQGKA